MKKVILLLLFFPYLSFGQIIDDFENEVITNWTEGTAGHWGAEDDGSISGKYSLHHIFDNSASGSDCIGLPLTNLHPSEGITRWSFMIKHGYDPSSSNSWALFLMSDHDPANFANGSVVNGFAAGVNLSGYDDTLRIWKLKKGSVSVVARCPVNWQNNIGTAEASKLVVERSERGEWHIMVYDKLNNLKGTASGSDPDLFNPEWTILNYRYTSTRDRLLWFDDLVIEGVFYEDMSPPEIKEFRITSTNSLELVFNEDPSDDILDASLFTLYDAGNEALTVQRRNPALIKIIFRKSFINKSKNHLTIKKLCDRSGNCIANADVDFTPVWAEPADIIISEIMADPIPSVSLPEKEYLEITNRTNFLFNMYNWKLSTESQKSVLPSTKINPGEIMIVCSSADTSLFSKYGKVIGLKSFPSLTDEGRIIWLSDSSGNFIHGVEYSSAWYGDRLKEGGGWSLEMIDNDSPFFSEGNWEASSSDIGGTPGKKNTASRSNPDETFFGITNAFPVDSTTIILFVSETMTGLAGSAENILIEGNAARSVTPVDPLMRKFIICSDDPFLKGREYTLFLSGDIHDYSGNEITRRSFRFGMPETANKHDIVFNEILFNPVPGDPDFIELYNCSGKIIDASRLYLASVSTETGDTSEVRIVSEESRCLLPGTFYTATTDRNKILYRYPASEPENIFNVPPLPSMPDDRGHLLLLNREMKLIDEVIYTDDMHYSLLADNEGVSLEKIRPEIESSESANWHSASENSGWATPGAVNSVYSADRIASDRISLSSGRISPDNDGHEDVLVIDLDLEGMGNVVTITIFDETGRFVKRLKENFLTSGKASVVWDATASNGSLASSGIYIILIDLYTDKGKTKSWKKVCAVVR
ncbi:MAG: lamin tail domain-containing protein [Bacteroidales bacterium]|jgi:hypothetical protein|nr:lamin tail domain-containing protein [Bacteroidales bacterium]